MGGRAALEPLFVGAGVPPNSDYYPILDQRAPRARFKHETAIGLPDIRVAHVPVLSILDRDTRQSVASLKDVGLSRPAHVDQGLAAAEALGIAHSGTANEARVLSPRGRSVALLARRLADDCPGAQPMARSGDRGCRVRHALAGRARRRAVPRAHACVAMRPLARRGGPAPAGFPRQRERARCTGAWARAAEWLLGNASPGAADASSTWPPCCCGGWWTGFRRCARGGCAAAQGDVDRGAAQAVARSSCSRTRRVPAHSASL